MVVGVAAPSVSTMAISLAAARLTPQTAPPGLSVMRASVTMENDKGSSFALLSHSRSASLPPLSMVPPAARETPSYPDS